MLFWTLREADRGFGGYIVALLANQSMYLGRYRQVVQYAETAMRAARTHFSISAQIPAARSSHSAAKLRVAGLFCLHRRRQGRGVGQGDRLIDRERGVEVLDADRAFVFGAGLGQQPHPLIGRDAGMGGQLGLVEGGSSALIRGGLPRWVWPPQRTGSCFPCPAAT